MPFQRSRVTVIATILLSGMVAGGLEVVTHLVVSELRAPVLFPAFLDASVIALMTMTLVAVLIAWAKARRREVVEQARTVASLNHHLRNALQVIGQCQYLPDDRRAQAIYASVDRIDEALRLLMPREQHESASSD